MANTFNFKGENAKKISFPLGGIGSGCVGLSGIGRLVDWEIFNRPNKESYNGYTHFAIKAEDEENNTVIDARVLQGDILEDFNGSGKGSHHSWGVGHGPNRTTLTGMPHFEDVSFTGEFPIASMNFKDKKFPGNVSLTAFNPFIPLNDKDSSIPAAFFEWTVHNPTAKELTYTLSFSCGNTSNKKSVNKHMKEAGLHMIKLFNNEYGENDLNYNNISIATNEEDVSYQEYWYRSGWFDDLTTYWKEFNTFGGFKNRSYEEEGNPSVGEDTCTLAPKFTVKPHEKKTIRFVLSWYSPNLSNYWDKKVDPETNHWKNYYTKLFTSSEAVADYCMKNWDVLKNETVKFKEALFTSTLPSEVLDAIQGNISILKSSTCLRLENGEFYAYEGVNRNEGSCPGSCTHVWNYAYALPFLFPKLERSMRELDYKYNLGEDGGMTFRIALPLGSKRSNFRPCVDGQLGGVLKTYRDWKICGDDEWLKKLWPSVKKSLEFTWSSENKDMWDPNKTGVITGRQHHTLDMELVGANSWLTGFYLAALKAAAIMAKHLGELDTAKEYTEIFEKGSKWVEENLFNGEYYIQDIDLKDKDLLDKYFKFDDSDKNYWNEEVNEIKYQVKDGCIIDQVLAQWHSNLLGLGDIFDKDNRKKAISSVYNYNFKNMRDFYNPCRIFTVNDEKGLIICEWPEHKEKQIIPIPYTEETMAGFEYAAAGLMLQEGLISEALEVIGAVRDRYNGAKRNPWCEIECGGNYARSMASYSFLLSLSGFSFDLSQKEIGFNPIFTDDSKFYRTFWSLEGAWGTFEIVNNVLSLHVLYGELELDKFLTPSKFTSVKKVFSEDKDIKFSIEENKVCFENTVSIKANQAIYFVL